MASTAYYNWLANGSPYHLCRPAAALQRILRGHGLTVYDYPDDGHLKATTPEDHTPFSATGWPARSAYGVGHAVDVMPRADTAAGRAENAAIARRLIAARNAGVPGVMWIKYLNWTDEQGICRQERWMPGHETRTSTDRGHIHISARSDSDNDDRADSYDPLEDRMTNLGYSDDDGKFLCERVNALLHLNPAVMGPEKGKSYPVVELLKRLERTLDGLAARPAPAVDVTALAAALAPLLADALDVELDAAAVLGVLESAEGQAALVQAANRAEDE